MWKALTLSLGIAFLATSASSDLAAQQQRAQCDKRAKVLDLLSQKYKESPVAIGVTTNGGLVEVLSAHEGGTWSIIITAPSGVSCLVAAGEGWRALEQASIEPEA